MRHFATFSLLASLVFSDPGFAQSGNLELDAILLESSDLMQSGQPEAALALLKRYETTYNSQPEFLNNLAIAYLGNADPVAALTILRQLVDSDPVFSIVSHNLLELELQGVEQAADTINPILFVQSSQSFFDAEMQQIEDLPASTPSAALPPVTPVTSQPAQTHLNVVRNTVRNRTLAWAEAWSNKNIEGYLEFYADDYQPNPNTSHQSWLEGRRLALGKPGDISVGIDDLEVEIDDDRAVASFTQSYSSSNYSDKVVKTLIYSYLDGRWKIVSETSTTTN